MTFFPPTSPSRSTTVTVVVPTRARTLFLEDARRSLLTQTHPVHEILLVDDGSPEALREKTRLLAEISERIRFLALTTHGGTSATRNAGRDQAAGDFGLFLDNDDLLHPRMRLIHMKLACFKLRCGWRPWSRHAFEICRHPGSLQREALTLGKTPSRRVAICCITTS
jgi:glycosyltransferase involved in cell wall biosynthesis